MEGLPYKLRVLIVRTDDPDCEIKTASAHGFDHPLERRGPFPGFPPGNDGLSGTKELRQIPLRNPGPLPCLSNEFATLHDVR